MRHHGHVSTDIKERPDTTTDETTSDDTPKFFHYVKKNKIAESAVMGTHVVALCGEVFPVTKSAKPGSRCAPNARRSTTACARATEVVGSGERFPPARGLGAGSDRHRPR